MAGQRVLGGCIRFSSMLLLAILGFHGTDLYNAVVVLEVFQLLPHGRQFLKGLQIMGQVGVVYYVWNMIVLVPACFGNGLALVLIGLGDLALALPLFFGVIYQSEYLPHSRSDCQYAATWKMLLAIQISFKLRVTSLSLPRRLKWFVRIAFATGYLEYL